MLRVGDGAVKRVPHAATEVPNSYFLSGTRPSAQMRSKLPKETVRAEAELAVVTAVKKRHALGLVL